MRLTPVLLVAGAGALGVSASANAHSQPHHQSPAHLHDKRTFGLLSGLGFGFGGGSSRPSASWRCDGSGKDGYSVDWLGLGRPFWVPEGWLYFGTSIGWAPPAGWECSASWSIPSLFLNIVHEVTWWQPSDAWIGAHIGVDLGFTAPSWWGMISLPAQGWKCDGSGKDGWSIDWQGKGRPSWAPSGWLWFGSSIGWAPPIGWSCDASWSLPSAFVDVCGSVSWWKPPSAWIDAHVGVDLGFTAPSWWGVISLPSRGWTCDGSGKDGWSIDWQGNGRPSWAPSGWLWFGGCVLSIGWAPPASWSCSSTWQIPSQWSSVWRVSWWQPGAAWLTYHQKHDFGWSIPSWWGLPSCGCSCGCGAKTSPALSSIVISTTSRAPSTTSPAPSTTSRAPSTTSRPAQTTTSLPTTTSPQKPSTTLKTSSSASCTSSTKAAATTTRKASTTTHKASTTTHKASSSTHKASSTKKVSTTSKKPSTKTSVQATTTYKPSTQTITVTAPGQIVTVTETHNLPPPPAPTSRPGQGWECSGSGDDGWDVDWQGNGCPSHLPSGWKWWGVSIGWGPSKGWDCGSNWTPSPAEVDSCSKTQWWTPPPSLQLPSGVECPAGWISIGWIDQRRPSASWTCDGTGRDGYDFDHFGNGRPSYLPVGWKWFGQLHGWQPCSSFQLPSSTWSPPSSWNPNLAVWWQPRAAWTLRGNFRCPRWWNRGHLRGSFRWW
ncbi:Proteophosphoglycan ppg4 [Rhodotorula toruloides]